MRVKYLIKMEQHISTAIWWLGAAVEKKDIDEMRRCVGNAIQALSSN